MLPHLSCYEPPNKALWHGRSDSLARERFFQLVDCINIQKKPLEKSESTVILGFCSDEGIRRNQGRVGAKLGPDAIREQLAKLACHHEPHLLDVGNIVCAEPHLEAAQEQLASLIGYCHQQGHKTIALGGGHEIAWAHFGGLSPYYPKLGIINFDAHFDLRPALDQQSTSGTPFWQISDYCNKNNLPFEYCCVGIQPVANTKSLFDYAKKCNVRYLTAEQMNQEKLSYQLAFIDEFIKHHDAIYLSICMDVFAESIAPGVSAPQAAGLYPWQALPLLKYIVQTGKVISLDIAELSPPLDQGQKTARLAANLLANLLNF